MFLIILNKVTIDYKYFDKAMGNPKLRRHLESR